MIRATEHLVLPEAAFVFEPASLRDLVAASGPLREVFAAWAAADDLSTMDVLALGERVGLPGRLHLLDASQPDPRAFRFLLYGSVVRRWRDCDFRATYVAEHPSATYAAHLIDTYGFARQASMPIAQKVTTHRADTTINHFPRTNFTRLILPLSAGGLGGVKKLLIAIQENGPAHSALPGKVDNFPAANVA